MVPPLFAGFITLHTLIDNGTTYTARILQHKAFQWRTQEAGSSLRFQEFSPAIPSLEKTLKLY